MEMEMPMSIETQETQEARTLTQLLSVERANSQTKWMELGLCLHNINPCLLDCWIDFSRKGHDYREGHCEQIWKSTKLRDNGPDIATLNQWAEQDNPIQYISHIKGNGVTAILNTYENEKQIPSVAMVIHTLYKYLYKYTKQGVWYEFINHRWRGVFPHIERRVSDALLESKTGEEPHYDGSPVESRWRCYGWFPPSLIGGIRTHVVDLYNEVGMSHLITKLIKDESMDVILKECQTLFYDQNFTSHLDQNPYLIGFENGVYDLHRGEFRDGLVTDYISLTTGNNYIEFKKDDELLVAINLFMSQIFPDDDVRNYVLILLSSFLEGGNCQEKFHIWNGIDIDCIKSLLRLFELSFGKYTERSPHDFLTQREGRYQLANREACRLRKIRFVSIAGENKHEKLNTSLIKEWSGGDLITYYDSSEEDFDRPQLTYKPLFKMVYYCTVPPYVSPDDQGMKRRLCVLEFQSRSVHKPDPNNQYEFKKNSDSDLNTKFQLWKEPFMYLLLQNYKIYKTQGLIEPLAMRKYNKEYCEYCREEYY
jgi:hypothetical protein